MFERRKLAFLGEGGLQRLDARLALEPCLERGIVGMETPEGNALLVELCAVIEPHYHLVDGTPKRFFTEAAVREMFSRGWTILSLEHTTTRKYVRSKALWEVAVEARA